MAPRGTLHVVPFEQPAHLVEASLSQPVALPPVELKRARRPGWPTLAALAIACGLAAVGLGAWAVFTESRAEQAREPDVSVERSLGVLADSSSVRYPLRASVGRIALVVTDAGSAVLALDGLGPAPEGSSYQVWMVRTGSATPVADTSFDGSARVVPLDRPVPPGTRVAVTLEPAGLATRPTRPLRLFAVRP